MFKIVKILQPVFIICYTVNLLAMDFNEDQEDDLFYYSEYYSSEQSGYPPMFDEMPDRRSESSDSYGEPSNGESKSKKKSNWRKCWGEIKKKANNFMSAK